MLVKNETADKKAVKTEEIKKKKSKLWLILVFAFFTIFIFLPLYLLLKAGLLYLPVLSDKFFVPAEASYIVDSREFSQQYLYNNLSVVGTDWHVYIGEEYLTYFLDNYLGEDWQLIVREGEFELYGPLMSALNNPEQKNYVRVDYEEDNGIHVFLNDLQLPKFISDYLIKKYLLSEEIEIDEKYFKELLLKEGGIEFVGEAGPWQDLLNNVNYDSLMQQVINYFIED